MKKRTAFLWFLIFMIVSFFESGCLRLSADAGVAWKGAHDETPKTKSVGFDTKDLVPGSSAPGSIKT